MTEKEKYEKFDKVKYTLSFDNKPDKAFIYEDDEEVYAVTNELYNEYYNYIEEDRIIRIIQRAIGDGRLVI